MSGEMQGFIKLEKQLIHTIRYRVELGRVGGKLMEAISPILLLY
jgi:hypothetical protein